MIRTTLTFKALGQILNARALVIAAFAILSTWLCRANGIAANFPLTILGTAVIFPIVFSIGGAYKRREAALREYGSLKAHGRAVFFVTRDWIAEPDDELRERARTALRNLLIACRELFRSPVSEMDTPEQQVYDSFSRLSILIKSLRDKGLSAGEVSRCNQYLSKMMVAFENIKHIYQYRTPRTLRAYSRFFIYVLPILYGPYFVHISQDIPMVFQYIVPVLFSVVLVSLDNIQNNLENPFDQIGEDDVMINAEKFVERLGP